MRRQKILIYLVSLIIIFSVIVISRKIIFNNIFEKLITRTEKQFGLDIDVEKASLTGLRTTYLSGIVIKTPEGKIIFESDSIAIDIKPFPLFVGKIRISSLSIYNTHVSGNMKLIRYFLKQRKPYNKNENKVPKNYPDIVNNIIEKTCSYIPDYVVVRNLSITYSHDSINSNVIFENFVYRNNKYIGDIIFADKKTFNHCFVSGNLNTKGYTITCKLQNANKNKCAYLPYIGERWQTVFGFDTLTLSCKFNKYNKASAISGTTSINNLQVYHHQLSPDTIKVNQGGFNYRFMVYNNSVELDSTSVVQLNGFSFSPYVKIEKDTSIKVTAEIIRKEFKAKDFFSSIPDGVFSNFNGFEPDGNLAYQLKASVDLQHPENVYFNSKLENIGFSVKKYGTTDFRIINGTFLYEVYEKNYLTTSFLVGPENPEFVSIQEISPYLQYSVLTAEDGDFYYHKGFNEKAFTESISKNLAEGRFARGGSTISMQLVKNIFLNRKKVISRKIEEALIVWIIENMKLSSKERMFEVYLNIIEWGPGVYGIKNAARFYFNKHPKDLSLSESIYLSSLIPRPKGFKYTFDNNGQLREYMKVYYELLSGIMLRRNQISPEDTINLKPISKLTGVAKNYLSKPDSTNIEDSLFFLSPVSVPAITFEQ